MDMASDHHVLLKNSACLFFLEEEEEEDAMHAAGRELRALRADEHLMLRITRSSKPSGLLNFPRVVD